MEDNIIQEDDDTDFSVSAAHLVGAVVDQKPADVGNMFADLVLDKIREKLEDKKQELAATYYGYQPEKDDGPEPEFDADAEEEKEIEDNG